MVFWISLVFWATELDTSLSSSICQPSSICGYRARGLSLFRGDKVKMVIELDDLSSSMTYRARWLIELGFSREEKERKSHNPIEILLGGLRHWLLSEGKKWKLNWLWIHRLSQYKLNSSFKLILCYGRNFLPRAPLPIPLLQPFDSKEQNRIRAQMSSGPQVLRWDNLLCAGPYTFFFLLMLGEGSTQRHQKSVRCKKGRALANVEN